MSDPNRLTVAMVMATPGTGWGGMEKHTADLAAGLSERGHRVHLLAHRTYNDRFAKPVYLHPQPFQLGRRNLWLKHRLGLALKTIEPDIIHAQGSKAASLVAGLQRRAHQATTRKLGTIHGTKSTHRPFDALNGVIGVSREIIDAVTHPNKRLIYNGLKHSDPAGQCKEPAYPIPVERPLLLAAGRLEPVKQFDRLIRAWVQSGSSGRLVILGQGSQRAPLELLIRKLGVEDRVLLPGHEPNIGPWLRAATACIISSSREGFPYVMLEALLSRCPVLTTPVSGVRDFVPTRCIAKSDSVDNIADLIVRTLSDAAPKPDSLAALFENSFQQANEKLSLKSMVSRTENFYYELLSIR